MSYQHYLTSGSGLFAGAQSDIARLSMSRPLTRVWTRGPDMAAGRWYPTVTSLADGRALITAGETNCDGCNVLLPEIYNPLTNQVSQLAGASMNFPYYPHMFALPDGRVLAAASSEQPIVSRVLDVATGAWSVVDPVAVVQVRVVVGPGADLGVVDCQAGVSVTVLPVVGVELTGLGRQLGLV